MQAIKHFSEHMNIKFNNNLIQAAISALISDRVSFTKHDIHVFIANECKNVLDIATNTYTENKPMIEEALKGIQLDIMGYETVHKYSDTLNAIIYRHKDSPKSYDQDFIRYKKYNTVSKSMISSGYGYEHDEEDDEDFDKEDKDETCEHVIVKRINPDLRVRVPNEMIQPDVYALYIHKDKFGNILILEDNHTNHSCDYAYVDVITRKDGEFRMNKSQVIKTGVNLGGKSSFKFTLGNNVIKFETI